MATNPFKAFIPFVVDPDYDNIDGMTIHKATDPSGGEWRRVGLVEPIKGEGYMVDLNGVGDLMAVQYNERILPGKVRDEALGKLVAKVEQQEGRKIGKKEYAQLRDQVEFDLLPKAFIRRTVVPVIVTKKFMLICTSSVKRAEDCLGILTVVWKSDIKPLQVMGNLMSQFRSLALDDPWCSTDGDTVMHFGATDNIVLKGANKKVIRIKDKPLDEADVQEMVRLAEYDVHELGVAYGESWDSEPDMTFTVSASMIFKRVETPGTKTSGKEYDLHAHATFIALQYRKMLIDFVEANGGQGDVAADDEDEL